MQARFRLIQTNLKHHLAKIASCPIWKGGKFSQSPTCHFCSRCAGKLISGQWFVKTLICQQFLDIWINQRKERVFIRCWWLFETFLRHSPLIFKWLCLEGIIRRNLFGLSIQEELEEPGAFICITYAVTPADWWLLGWQIWHKMVTWGSWISALVTSNVLACCNVLWGHITCHMGAIARSILFA